MFVEILYFIKIRGKLINIHEVTDFHGGFLTIFSAVRSNTRWTTQLMNVLEIFYDPMGIFNNTLVEDQICGLLININEVTVLCGGFLAYFICGN